MLFAVLQLRRWTEVRVLRVPERFNASLYG
jgi:hypothetical protein